MHAPGGDLEYLDQSLVEVPPSWSSRYSCHGQIVPINLDCKEAATNGKKFRFFQAKFPKKIDFFQAISKKYFAFSRQISEKFRFLRQFHKKLRLFQAKIVHLRYLCVNYSIFLQKSPLSNLFPAHQSFSTGVAAHTWVAGGGAGGGQKIFFHKLIPS